ncbi:CapA family protein [Pyxidicoccus xibeiensis]|uniref:CapA family protein n=1 Tax=Pyxidicoccus xibeiensis TaxID=2906759 RepID=UPI0020A82CF0|nr:CapA family protein [Pyxidicoccus xibeiensis]MCP3143100.1 CapA family protein [Pyxidicoccus xibeiensis]
MGVPDEGPGPTPDPGPTPTPNPGPPPHPGPGPQPQPEPPPVLTTCAPEPAGDSAPLPDAERQARRAYACTGIALEGTVLSTSGAPVSSATVKLGDTTVRTGANGRFRFPVLARHNALLQVEAEGFRPSVVAVELRRGLSETHVTLPSLRLTPKDGGVRMLFSGDVSLGRRFLDPSEQTPRNQLPKDHPDALIQASDPLPGTKEVFTHVRPFFQAAEFRALNLETPVTDRPGTPHGSKDFAFFTLPGSLPALRWLGADYVSMGNNHVYDYLASGLEDTLRHVTAAGLSYSGAGRTPEEAFRPWRTSLAGADYSFVSMCSIAGSEHEHDYVAGPTQGGAADLRDTGRVASALNGERDAGRVPIALLHTGVEYSERPASFTAWQLRNVVDQGAKLVIAHHPHTPQGFLRYKGVLVAQSLGNFAFDQDRLETMVGLLAEVEMNGATVSRARALPVYLEDYRPRPVTGELAEGTLRNLSELSREGGVTLVPHLASGELLSEGDEAAVSERTVEVPVTVDASGAATVDLRALRREGESLAAAELLGAGGQRATAKRLRAGRDVLLHGDFEDHDVDPDANEAVRWELEGGAGFVCQDTPHRGAAALCQSRGAGDRGEAVVDLHNRLRLPGFAEGRPRKELTLVGWLKGKGAGAFRVVVQYQPIQYSHSFGEQEALRHPGGTFDWTQVSTDLRFPQEPARPDLYNAPWALQLSLRSAPPARGDGLSALDDFAVVAWERDGQGATLRLDTPHARDFVRVEAASGGYTLRVTFREHRVP